VAIATPKTEPTSRAKQRRYLIKVLMLSRDITVNDVAARLGVSPSFVSQLIGGSKRSKAKENALCQILGISRDKLWN